MASHIEVHEALASVTSKDCRGSTCKFGGVVDSSIKVQNAIEKFCKDFPDVSHIETAEAEEMINDAAVSAASDLLLIIDVRQHREYAVSHLAGAKSADFVQGYKAALPLVEEAIASLEPEQELVIICYCALGYRASVIADRLKVSKGSSLSYPTLSYDSVRTK